MPANTNPIFALDPDLPGVAISGATTDKSGATAINIVELFTFGTFGGKNGWIKFKFTGTSTAGTALVWALGSDGVTKILIAEALYGAVTSSTIVATAEVLISTLDWNLRPSQKLFVGATTVNTVIHVTAGVGDF
jgi:hypothetical protein